jgi:hypothetical protein
MATATVYTKTQIDTALALKAPLASPALTGTPTVPTAATGTSTIQAASTAYVVSQIAVSGATAPYAAATTTAGATFDVTAAHLHTVRTLTLGANLTITINATNPSSSIADVVTLYLKQPASGGPYTVTWPTTLEWPEDASAPAIPTAANGELCVRLEWTGTVWRAFPGGRFLP